MKYLLLFENFEPEKSKTQLKKELWRKNNPIPEGKILSHTELEQYNLPDKIINEMEKWPIIYKSPYSNSFYSSDQISWSSKPDKSYRVSDHWNFYTRGKIHCKTTTKVANNTHYSLGIFDEKTRSYTILFSEPTNKYFDKIKKINDSIEKNRDPDTIKKKKIFKDRIRNGEVFAKFTIDNKSYYGRVVKYTGPDRYLKIVDDFDEVIYSTDNFKAKDLVLFDKNKSKIVDVYNR